MRNIIRCIKTHRKGFKNGNYRIFLKPKSEAVQTIRVYEMYKTKVLLVHWKFADQSSSLKYNPLLGKLLAISWFSWQFLNIRLTDSDRALFSNYTTFISIVLYFRVFITRILLRMKFWASNFPYIKWEKYGKHENRVIETQRLAQRWPYDDEEADPGANLEEAMIYSTRI